MVYALSYSDADHVGVAESPSYMDDGALPDCPPSKVSNSDFGKAMGHSREEIDTLGITKFYISQLIDLPPSAEPPYALFQKDLGGELNKLNSDELDMLRDFGIKLTQLIDGNDGCDKVGARYIGRFIKAFCPNSGVFGTLPRASQELALSFFSYPLSESAVIKNAIKWSGCNYKSGEHKQ